MAGITEKRQLDSLNAFIHQRLTNIAGEICQVFQETLSAYQEEINQSKQENVYLRKMLAEISLDRTQRLDSQSSPAGGFPPGKQNCSRTPADPAASVIHVKLELSTTQQDLELPKQPSPSVTRSPICEDRAEGSHHDTTDDEESHTDGLAIPFKQPAFNQEPQNSNPAQIQVKLEPWTEHEKAQDSQEQLNSASSFSSSPLSTAGNQEQHHCFSVKTGNVVATNIPCSTPTLAASRKPESLNQPGLSSAISHTPENSGEHLEPSVKDESNDCSRLKPRTLNHVFYRPLYCEVCRKPFQNEWHLKRHLLKHQNKRPNCCELCGKCYSTPHVLKIHFRTHTGERPYHCKFCEKTFSQIGHLKGHERIHTGEKIYSCSTCGKCFTWLSQAKEHIRSHPGQTARVQRKINQ